MTTRSVQIQVQLITDLRAKRPDPSKIPGGYFFLASDTQELFVLLRDQVNPPSWELVSGDGGLDVKKACVTSTTAPLPAYSVSVDFNTLTATAPGALGVVGGFVPVVGERILVKDQAGGLAADDGIFVLVQEGDGTHPWILTRADDAIQGELVSGSFTFIEEGTLAATSWILVTPDPITVGITLQQWNQFSGAGTYTARTPSLTLVGNQFENTGMEFTPGTTRTFASHPAATNAESFVPLDSSGGAFAQALPAANTFRAGQCILFVDVHGSATTNPITITPNGGDTIAGSATLVLNVAHGSWTLESDGASNWNIVAGSYAAKSPALSLVGEIFTPLGLALSPSTLRTFASHPAVAATETFVPYDTSGGSFTIALPSAATVGSTFVLFTQDVTGSNGTNPVTFTPNGSDTIEGQATYLYGNPYGGVAFRSDGVSKWTRITREIDPQYKSPVLAVFTTALPAYTVSANKLLLTANANAAIPSADGIALAVGNSVLLPVGAADADNGIYVVQQVGDGGNPWILRRRSDADVTGRIVQDTRVAVQQGTTYGGQVFYQTVAGPITIGTTVQSWQSTTNAQYFVDPNAGSDANTGTAASPLKTWNAGVWPIIKKLNFTNVQITYTTSTVDTSTTGNTYKLPTGVLVTISSPWADVGLGTQTATAGSTSTVTVGGAAYVVNAYEGTRLRWLTSANGMAGQVYFVPRNTATIFQSVGGKRVMTAAAAANDTFVIERPSGGFSVGVGNVSWDLSAPGCGLTYLGFKYAYTSNSASVNHNSGEVVYQGFELDRGTSTGGMKNANCRVLIGSALGFQTGQVAGTGSANALGAYIHGTATSGSFGDSQGCVTMATDLVFAGCRYLLQQGVATVTGIDLHGTNTITNIQIGSNQRVQINSLTQQGAQTAATGVVAVNDCSQVQLFSCSFDATLATDCVRCASGGCQLELSSCTGGGVTGGKFGLVVSNGMQVTDLGSNTITGGGGNISFGALGAIAWPAGGTLTTDLTLAIVTAGTSQGCVMRS